MPTDTHALVTPTTDEQVARIARLISLAFGGTLPASDEWLRTAGLEHVRAFARPTAPAAAIPACLLRVPMGQYFGGRAVPMLGVAGVAVAPEARGRGLARDMMNAFVASAHSEGFPLAALYASTQSLYQQSGYEQAGYRYNTRIDIQTIGVRERGGEVVALGADDRARVRACYARWAAVFNGALDRGDYCWKRIERNRDQEFDGFGIARDAGHSELDGYVYFSRRRDQHTGRHDIIVSDLAFLTPAAGRRILGFLSDLGSMGLTAIIPGAPAHPITALMPQQRFDVEKRDIWMLRIVDAAKAIAGRGYSTGVALAVTIEVEDPLITGNRGVWRLELADGKAALERTQSRPQVTITERGLAALYSGMRTPAELALLGLIRGDATALQALAAAFAGPTPWMSDMF